MRRPNPIWPLLVLPFMALYGCGGKYDGRATRRETRAYVNAIPEPSQGETYDRTYENPTVQVQHQPVSTFAIDVDTASYSNVRRFLNQHQLPPKEAVRVEELINYFRYEYPKPGAGHPIAVSAETATCPWQTRHQLVRIGLQGRRIDSETQPARNLVFLIDVSGSMDAPNKLPLVKSALEMLVEKLTIHDRVAIVVYAGGVGLALPSTPGRHKDTIRRAIRRLSAEGSTNGAGGIQLAYRIAQENFLPQGVNRVMLATDGDFNVGITDQNSLVRLIEEQRQSGVFLTVLGFGMGNLKDATLEKLADKGNGHYAYIDTRREAQRALITNEATLTPIARDVKVQIEFNPRRVTAYRLIGYENRRLRKQDFDNDRKAGGVMGAGHSVTALYEITPSTPANAEPLEDEADELLTVKVRYQLPAGESSKLLEMDVHGKNQTMAMASVDFRFMAGVAAFGMLLRESPYKGNADFGMVRQLAGKSRTGDRMEFLQLVDRAEQLTPHLRRPAIEDDANRRPDGAQGNHAPNPVTTTAWQSILPLWTFVVFISLGALAWNICRRTQQQDLARGNNL